MYLSVFSYLVIMDKVHFIIPQGFARRKYLDFFFPRFSWRKGGGRGLKFSQMFKFSDKFILTL